MTKPLVYLAGPVLGLTFSDSDEWRTKATALFGKYGVQTCSPLRGKSALKSVGVITDVNPEGIFLGDHAIFTRDVFDVRRCDLVLANFATAPNDLWREDQSGGVMLPAERISVGTAMEVMLAWALGKYVVSIVALDSAYQHPFLREASSVVVPTLEKGIWASLVALGMLK